ncbi:MAG: low affinity iron permease family protein [Acidobacteria bacterium]|nr:low affinity iron permease family protein [Acidobacteriota bacterium]
MSDFTSRAGVSATVFVLLLCFGITLSIMGFPGNWEVGFATVVSLITLLMLFVIQHTQSRHQKVLQLKLDELIRASPNADDLLVHIEAAPDNELIEREQGQVAHHESLRESDELEVIEFKKNPNEMS